ncbi:AfsR/SARP family transcriptional regulator [Virgisporangium aurantiacum]|nr:tetratricopeptide repeat protein [Virgisporangium aurantiacum]
MEFQIIGPTTLRRNGRRVPLGPAKQRGMLAVLLYHAGEPVRVSTMVDHLWEGRDPDECRANLYAVTSRVRAVLGAAEIGASLVRVNGLAAYRLDVNPETVDYHRFSRLTRNARDAAARNDFQASIAAISDAIPLWGGEPVSDLRGERADGLRREMRGVWLGAHKLLAKCRLRSGQPDHVLAQLDSLIHDFNLDESLAQLWISALCGVGREDDARAYLDQFRARYLKTIRAEPRVHVPVTHASIFAPGSRSEFPAEAGRPHQLPSDLRDFSGRIELLAELDALTSAKNGSRVVVIGGMPGAGKSTLATHFGHLHLDRFPDGQLYLDAHAFGPAPAVSPDVALSGFLQALGVPVDRIPAGVEQRRDRLNRLLVGRRVLIVIDNARDADQVRPLLPAADGCLTLITSRNRMMSLSVREGARHVTVGPLSDRASTALLAGIIGARAAAEPGAVRTLVHLAGGLPLALRLLGEQVAERSRTAVADLVSQLRMHVLDDVGEAAGLRTAFAWSYSSLTASAARLFRTLGNHPGMNIGPGAAAALAGIDPDEVPQLLNTLARGHLINREEAPDRYRFHDLIRKYATDRALREDTTDDLTGSMRRLADFYLLSAARAAALLAPNRPAVPDLPTPIDVAPESFTGGAESAEETAIKWCQLERANLVAVASWAGRNGLFRHAWQIPAAVHEIFERYGRQDDMRELHELALRAVDEDGHLVGRTATLCNLGSIYVRQRDYTRARKSFEQGIDVARQIGLDVAETACSHNLASLFRRTGEPARAIELYQDVLARFRAGRNAAGEVAALRGLADASRRLGRFEAALAYLTSALSVLDRVGSMRGHGATHHDLADLYLVLGQLGAARNHIAMALRIHARIKDDAAHCEAFATSADIALASAENQAAMTACERALTLADELGDSCQRARILAILADAQTALGDHAAASRAHAAAVRIVDDLVAPEADEIRDRLAAARPSLP